MSNLDINITRKQPDRDSKKDKKYYDDESEEICDTCSDNMATASQGAGGHRMRLTSDPSQNSPDEMYSRLQRLEQMMEKMQSDTNNQMANMNKIMSEIEDKVSKLEDRMSEQDDKINKQDDKMNKLEEKINSVLSQQSETEQKIKVERIKTDVTQDIRQDINQIVDQRIQETMQAVRENVKETNKKMTDFKNVMQQEKIKLEATSLQTQIIISGHNIPAETIQEDTLQIAKNLMQDHLQRTDRGLIKNARRFKFGNDTRRRQTNRSIIIETPTVYEKRDIIHEAIRQRPEGLYFNEMVPQQINSLLYRLRKLKKQKKLSSVFTRDGIIKVKKSQTGKTYDIVTEEDLHRFLQEAGIEEEFVPN